MRQSFLRRIEFKVSKLLFKMKTLLSFLIHHETNFKVAYLNILCIGKAILSPASAVNGKVFGLKASSVCDEFLSAKYLTKVWIGNKGPSPSPDAWNLHEVFGLWEVTLHLGT